MGKLVRNYRGDPDDIKRRILAAANQVADYKEQSAVEGEGEYILFMVYNHYFLRNNSEASLSLVIVSRPEETRLMAISAGSGYGILRMDLGAADRLIQMLKEALEQNGL